MEVATVKKAARMPQNIEDLVVRVNENPIVYSSTDLDDDSIADSLQYFVFNGHSSPFLHKQIKKNLIELKKSNPAAYENLAFYTTYKLDKMFPLKNQVESEDVPGTYVARHQLVKRHYWIPLSTSKLHMRVICSDSMKAVERKKNRHPKRISPRFFGRLKPITEDPK